MHVKKKLHDRAVKEKIAKPKKTNFVGKYIAPIWRENHIGSSDEEDDDAEALKKAERKKKRQEDKAKNVAALAEARELARRLRTEDEAKKEAKAAYVPPKDLRVGQPRESSNF
jgi:hypothetical protein